MSGLLESIMAPSCLGYKTYVFIFIFKYQPWTYLCGKVSAMDLSVWQSISHGYF